MREIARIPKDLAKEVPKEEEKGKMVRGTQRVKEISKAKVKATAVDLQEADLEEDLEEKELVEDQKEAATIAAEITSPETALRGRAREDCINWRLRRGQTDGPARHHTPVKTI